MLGCPLSASCVGRFVLPLFCLLAALSAFDVSAASVEPGSVAPDISLPALNGEQRIELSHLRGHLLLVDFWASWCGPCHQSLPRYAQLQREFAARGFQVVAISVDESRTAAQDFSSRIGADLSWAWDGDGASAARYGLKGMPSAFLIDAQGVVRHRLTGFKSRDEQPLRARIIELLAEQEDE